MKKHTKEISRQIQIYICIAIILIITIFTLVLVYFDKDVTTLNIIVPSIVAPLVGAMSVNLWTKTDGDE